MAQKDSRAAAPKNAANPKGSAPKAGGKPKEDTDSKMALTRDNYKWMLAGLGLIVVGFLLMGGSSNTDPAVFNEDIFSFRRITLAPIVVLAGFVVEIYGIMKRPKSKE